MLQSARVRKLIGLVALLVFIGVYVVAMSTIGDYVPKHWAAQLVYYVLAGTLWGVPILPLLSWMNRGR